MLLVLDIGNTNIVLGVYDGDTLAASWRVATVAERTDDEHVHLVRDLLAGAGITPDRIEGVIVACVVPRLADPITGMCEKLFTASPTFVTGDASLGVKIDYRSPGEVGADRIANAAAAHALYGCAVIVVDFGTATTFDAVAADGTYLGGAIAPGIQVATDALVSRTSQLHSVAFACPASPIGKTTTEGIQSGMYYGLIGQVEKLVASMREAMGGPVKVIATGGLAKVIASDCPCIEVVHETLTLEGLRILWERRG